MAFIKALSSTKMSRDQRGKRRRVTARGGGALSSMLRAKDVALTMALATLKLTPALTIELLSSPALLKEQRRAIAEIRRARRPTVPVGRRSPEGSVSSQRSLHQRAGRLGAAGLAESGGSSEPAAKRPAPDVGSKQPPATTSRATC